jgi:hypothetical protein
MKPATRLLMVCVVCLVWSSVGRGELPERLRRGSAGVIGSWPEFLMTVGVLYAPAPLIQGQQDGEDVEDKLRDQAGPRFTMEWRLADYLLLGGVFDIVGADGTLLFEAGARVGAIFPIDRDWCLYGLASGGGAIWVTEPPDRAAVAKRGYIGWRAALSLGVRYRFSDWVGSFFELTGVANGFKVTSDIEDPPDGGVDRYDSPTLLRLQLVMGISFDWSRAMRTPGRR